MKQGFFLQHIGCILLTICVSASMVLGQTSLSSNPQSQPSKSTATSLVVGKKNVAVINLKSTTGVTSGEAEIITDRLRGELFNTGLVNVMERDQMQEVLKEQGFQQSGACTNEDCMVEIGHLLGVEQLITGSLGKVGAMFLVNLRVIDVKTAKIMKVVSVDIKGNIEDVVGELQTIAVQITSQATPQRQVVDKEKKEAEKQTVLESETPKEKEAEVKAPEKPEPVPVVDEQEEKNKNRAGIKIGMTLYGDNVERKWFSYVDSASYEFYDTVNYKDLERNSDITVTRSPVMNFFLKFGIKAGPFIVIDIGTGWTHNQTDYEIMYAATTTKLSHIVNEITLVGMGVNFVKRWYPIKMNIGIFGGINYLDYTVERSYKSASAYSSSSSYVLDTTLSYFSLNGDYGARAGVEFLLGKHIGIATDFVFRNSSYITFPTTVDNSGNYSTTTWSQVTSYQIQMPLIGFGLGFNFYF